MEIDCSQLCSVLEAELTVGQKLAANLEALKNAIVTWDIERLLLEIDARQPAIDTLVELETRRNEILCNLDGVAIGSGLRAIIDSMASDAPERQRLIELRDKNRHTFIRLHAQEHSLIGLMENLLAHIHDALTPLLQGGAPLYGDTGAARLPGAAAALIHSKA